MCDWKFFITALKIRYWDLFHFFLMVATIVTKLSTFELFSLILQQLHYYGIFRSQNNKNNFLEANFVGNLINSFLMQQKCHPYSMKLLFTKRFTRKDFLQFYQKRILFHKDEIVVCKNLWKTVYYFTFIWRKSFKKGYDTEVWTKFNKISSDPSNLSGSSWSMSTDRQLTLIKKKFCW